MNRREVLKNLGLGAGFLVATPTVMSLLQSCTSEPEFNPLFLSKGQGHALRRMVDLILPTGETVPGAVDVGVHEFMDKYWNAVSTPEQQAQMKMGFGILEEQFKSTFSKEISEGKAEDFDQLLSKYLKTTKEEQTAYGKKMGEFAQAFEKDPTVKPDADAAMFSLLSGIRGMAIWGWKSSEAIGKNVLWYDPIPAQQKGCIALSEAGNGKVMSL